MAEVILLGQMGVLERLGHGGQGVVYRAPSVRTAFARSMVYKEYKAATLASLDVNALRAMPEFLESLAYGDGAELIAMAAWPCRVVEDGAVTTGFVMPAIPDEFFCDFWTSNAVMPSKVMAEFQHLLNDPQVVAARFGGTGVSDRQRYELLRAAASALSFLHERGVCVGDISPKNLLFSLAPAPAVYFVDCDAMRVKGVSLSHQVETPGWGVPAGEEKATVLSDRYKLGLLALRLLVGDQDVRDPARLPGSVPVWLASVITETLTAAPGRRPDLGLWQAALDDAIPNASRQAARATRAQTTPRSAPQPAPPPPSPTTSPPRPPPPPPPPPTPVVAQSNKLAWLMIPAALLALFVIVKVASDSTGDTSTTAKTTVTSTPAWTPTQTVTETATQTAPPTREPTATPPAIPSGDLNLGTPMSRPACNGTGIVIVGNATTPRLYREDVARLLADNPGSNYLRTDMSCRSLKQKSDDGDPIYAVYYIAGRSRSQVCGLKAQIRSAGNDVAYGKWLDSEARSEGIEC